MTPAQHADEEARLVALIRALRADISDPVALAERIARDEATIAALQQNVIAQRERQAQLPVILESTIARLQRHRESKPSTNSKVARLLKLKEIMNALIADIESDSNS